VSKEYAMRVSVTYPLRNPPEWAIPYDQFYRDHLDHMRYVEDLGFDNIWLQRHHFEESGYGASFAAFAGALAVTTRRIRVGSYITILPLYHPLLVAEEAAVLDHLLGGRLDVGVGIGHRLVEFQVLGVPPRQRPSRMEEGVAILRRAWTEDPVSFQGRRYAFENVTVQPKPLQKPHPPLWMAARTVAAAERAARLDCHLQLGTVDPVVPRAYYHSLATAGKDPARYHVSKSLSITLTHEDPEAVWERLRPHAAYKYGFYDVVAREFGDPAMRLGAGGAEEEYRANEVIGDPETILRAIAGLRDQLAWNGLSFDELVLHPALPGRPMRECYPSFELFAKEVMPVIRSW
jgi:alkanesulfonate monooxygenase SsuD/methylene tetrahydromethanopterin reductase-like flavin-dependent oxidoreductase (luciferase family)